MSTDFFDLYLGTGGVENMCLDKEGVRGKIISIRQQIQNSCWCGPCYCCSCSFCGGRRWILVGINRERDIGTQSDEYFIGSVLVRVPSNPAKPIFKPP